MTATDLDDLEALLNRVLSDPSGYLDRVIEQLLGRLGGSGGPDLGRWAETTVPVSSPNASGRLADQNLVLAAALGACECWGEVVDCTSCAGEGGPGWALPDPDLYKTMVAPASRRVSRHQAARRQSRSAKERTPEVIPDDRHEEGEPK